MRWSEDEGQTLGVFPFLHNPVICAQRGRRRQVERGEIKERYPPFLLRCSEEEE